MRVGKDASLISEAVPAWFVGCPFGLTTGEPLVDGFSIRALSSFNVVTDRVKRMWQNGRGPLSVETDV